jgi:hypothetical protein
VATGCAAGSRRPRSSPNRITEDIKKQAIGVRAALEQSGLDHGPVSVHEKMRDLGMAPGSLDSGAGANLPRRERRPGRAAEEGDLIRPVGWDGVRI